MTRNHNKVRRTKNNGADPWMSFFVKILFVATIILLLPKLVDARRSSRPRRQHQKKKRFRQIQALRDYCLDECDDNDIGTITLLEESLNCVYRCVSDDCYEDVYGNEPLEDGEIDMARYKNFEICVLSELKEEARRERQQQREARKME